MRITKKWFLIAGGLAVLATATAYISRPAARARSQTGPEAGMPALKLVRLADGSQGFGPEMEATLPAAGDDGQTVMLNLGTGQSLTAPGLKHFEENAAARSSWIRTNDLNISGRVWPNGVTACVTYNLTMVAIEAKCWEETAVESVRRIPALGPNHHSPSRLIILKARGQETYAFRTDNGTLGLLRLVGLSDDGQGVTIRYKLLQPPAETAGDP